MKSNHSYKKTICTLLLFLFFSSKTFSQSYLLDSLTLDTMKASTSIEEALKHPEQVVKLELRKDKLTKFPDEIFKFTNLQYLDLSKNNIKSIPPEIGQLKNLQYFAIAKNNLEALPSQIGDLTNLYYLNINQNDLYSLPVEIYLLKKLKNLDLWSNNIDKFPNEIKNLESLQILDLRSVGIPDSEQRKIKLLLPKTKIYFSPFCQCQQ